jgi:hypothetical protein
MTKKVVRLKKVPGRIERSWFVIEDNEGWKYGMVYEFFAASAVAKFIAAANKAGYSGHHWPELEARSIDIDTDGVLVF